MGTGVGVRGGGSDSWAGGRGKKIWNLGGGTRKKNKEKKGAWVWRKKLGGGRGLEPRRQGVQTPPIPPPHWRLSFRRVNLLCDLENSLWLSWIPCLNWVSTGLLSNLMIKAGSPGWHCHSVRCLCYPYWHLQNIHSNHCQLVTSGLQVVKTDNGRSDMNFHNWNQICKLGP